MTKSKCQNKSLPVFASPARLTAKPWAGKIHLSFGTSTSFSVNDKYGRTIGICVLVLFWYLCFGIYHLYAQDKIAAIVNNEIITQKDLNDFTNFMRMQMLSEEPKEDAENKIQAMKLDLLNKLIEDSLILQEAKKSNIVIDESRVKAKINEIRGAYTSDAEFQGTLAKQGLTQADLEAKIKNQLLMYRIIDLKIRNRMIINPAEVTEFYRQNTEKFKLPQQRAFEAVKVKEQALSEEIYAKLKEGRQFNDVAKEYSIEITKFNPSIRDELSKDIQDVIFVLKPGETHPPVKIKDDFYIFKLTSIIASKKQNLTEVQDNIYTFLFDKKMQDEIDRWLDQLRKQTYIKIM